MHLYMPNWTTQIDRTTGAFREQFGSLTGAQLNWKPDPNTWSIAQNIDHLIVINETYFPLLEDMRAGRLPLPWYARVGFLVSFFGKMILKASDPNRKNKTKTFSIWEPTESKLPADILDRFAEHQEELKRQIEASAGFVEKGTVISSPANRNIVYKLETAFDIITAHELRHLEQAKEVLGIMKKREN
jgi:hypothetical protein